MNDYYFFSVIIPHKNSPELLLRCIKSIPMREDVQVIVVDDNSDKGIVDWGAIDFGRKVELYQTVEGRGAGFARNIGLKYAEGTWVLFIDCDDTFTENLPTLLDKYKNSDADAVYFNYNRWKGDEMKSNACPYLAEQNDETAFQMKFGMTVPWNKMVKRCLITANHIMFEECPVGNDIFYTYQVGYFTKDNYAVENVAAYNYYESVGSITRSKKNDEAYYLTICKHIYQCNAFYKFMERKQRSKSMLAKFAAILSKKGFSQFLLCLRVYFSHYAEIRQSRNDFVNRFWQVKELSISSACHFSQSTI